VSIQVVPRPMLVDRLMTVLQTAPGSADDYPSHLNIYIYFSLFLCVFLSA